MDIIKREIDEIESNIIGINKEVEIDWQYQLDTREIKAITVD